MKRLNLVLFTMVLFLAAAIFVSAEEARLLRFPDIHGEKVVFVYGGDIWTVSSNGGTAARLTSHQGLERFPKFSPDGKWIAFTGQYDGSDQVYIIPAPGGEPRQLTYYPAVAMPELAGVENIVCGWTPGGKIFFRSVRDHFSWGIGRIYSVDPEGGLPQPLPMPISGFASFSPDGKRIAYNRIMRDFRSWKRYKGGRAQDVWIFDLVTNEIERITGWEGTDNFPMWYGDRIYFTSDRQKRLNLYYYDLNTKETVKVTDFETFDVKFPGMGEDRIIFENGGWLYVLDLPDGKPRKLKITLTTDAPLTRPKIIDVSDRVSSFDPGPKGKQAVFTARGEVFTVPAKKGNTRNLTNTPGIREKYAAWSPDGKWIAYVSDSSGEDEIYLRPADGPGKEIALTTGGDRCRFAPIWSPDSQKLLFSDKSLRLFYIDIGTKKPVKIDQAAAREISDYQWSPDSQWVTYSKCNDVTWFSSIYIYSLADKSVFKLTGDYTTDANPVFDPGGKYLYFLSARDFSPSFVSYEFNHFFRKMDRPYAIILQADGTSPFAPKGDDKNENKTGHPGMKIDLPGIQERVVAFPVQRDNYGMLRAARDHIFYCKFNDDNAAGLFVYNHDYKFGWGSAALYVFNLDDQKETKLRDPVSSYSISPDGKKLLYRSGSAFGILDAAPEQAKPGGEKIDLSGMEMWRHPRKEWHNCFYETWRLFRDFFYVPNLHGVDWLKIRETYAEFLPYISTRDDLTYVLSEMVGELGASHCYVGGGDKPTEKYHGVGLPGATFEPTKSGFYKISKIYAGENWHENFRSPLTEPGIHVKAGEYILAIDGTELRTDDNPYRLLVNKTGGTIELTVNNQPHIKGSRRVNIKPIPDETKLRYYNWVKRNRDYVTEKTGGRVGYIHLPNMSEFGASEFGKWFYGQLDKDGLIIDSRFNSGGFVSDQILERINRRLLGMENNRNLSPYTYPYPVAVGPKAALTNLYAGSDGDYFAFYWKKYKLGPLIGTRTWGGVIAVRAFTPMLDGGYIYVPVGGMYDLNSKFIIENQGVIPDIEIDNLPKDVIAGKDPQLDKAIELVLKAMKDYKPWRAPKPTEYPER